MDQTLGNSGDERGPVELTFSKVQNQDKWNANLTIDTVDLAGDAAHGSITVQLKPNTDEAYTVSTTSGEDTATVMVNDNETPVISITPATETLASQDAVFTLSSNIKPYQSLSIKYIPTNTPVNGGSFLEN